MAAEVSGGGEIADRTVASALEFAVGIAAAGSKLRPQLPFPAELKPFLKFTKLPAKALRDVRRAVEGDPEFFRRLAMVAVPDLLDEAGMLWLTRPEGWEAALAELSAAGAGPGDAQSELRRAERRRDAAEQVAERSLAELVALRVELDRLQQSQAAAEAEVIELRRERDALRGEAAAHHTELRRAVNRLATAQARLEAQRVEAQAAAQRADDAERMRDEVLADRAGGQGERSEGSDRSGVDAVLAGAREVAADLARQAETARTMAHDLGRLVGRMASLEPAPASGSTVPPAPRRSGRRGRRVQRVPVGLPGGVYGSSNAAAEFLVRQPGMAILVDGYNVAKLGWPRLELEEQRDRGIEACEDVARRFGAHIAVVFDGSTVAGAAATRRRLVRVAFSPEGVLADDVLRNEVEALPDDTPVLVVTNDQAVLTDVRAMGANTLSSEQWLELARR